MASSRGEREPALLSCAQSDRRSHLLFSTPHSLSLSLSLSLSMKAVLRPPVGCLLSLSQPALPSALPSACQLARVSKKNTPFLKPINQIDARNHKNCLLSNNGFSASPAPHWKPTLATPPVEASLQLSGLRGGQAAGIGASWPEPRAQDWAGQGPSEAAGPNPSRSLHRRFRTRSEKKKEEKARPVGWSIYKRSIHLWRSAKREP